MTVAAGRNDTDHGSFSALLAEATERRGAMSFYTRLEVAQEETALLVGPTAADPASDVTALTLGAVRDVGRWWGFEVGAGGDVTGYVVPDALAPSYGRHPVSLHVFVRVRPPAGHMGRIWNMRMTKPMQ